MTEIQGSRAALPVLELLESAWDLMANAHDGEHEPPDWTRRIKEWREEYHAFLKGVDANIAQPDPEPPLPDGEYARVEIKGHDDVTGWVTDGTRGGTPVMVVRDWDGRVLSEVPGHSLHQFVPLATPLKRPGPASVPRALGVAVDGWDSDEDSVYDDGREEGPF